MKLKHLFIATLPSLLSLQPLSAQTSAVADTLVREMVIENEYTPIVKEASKINQLPTVSTPEVEKSHISYSTWATPLYIAPQIETIGATPFSTTKAYSKERGYLDLAMGNHWNASAAAGYRVIDNRTDSLAIWLTHRSTNGTTNFLGTDIETTQRFNNNLINAAYMHRFTPFDLAINADYGYNLFNYYGYRGEGDAALQQVNQGGVNIGITSNNSFAHYYKFALGYELYDNREGATTDTEGVNENHIWADINLAAHINELWKLGIDFRYDQLVYNSALDAIDNYGMLTANPYLQGESGGMKVRAGFIANLSINNQQLFNIAPDVTFEWEFAPSYLLTASATGGKRVNTLRHMAQECIYMNPSLVAANSYTPANFRLALSTNALSSFWTEVYGGYRWINDAAIATVQLDSATNGSLGVIDYMAKDLAYWQAGATAKYRYNTLLEARLDVHVNGCDISYAQNIPQLEASFDLLVRPIDKLSIEASYYLAAGREAYVQDTNYSMDNVHNLQLGASYALTRKAHVDLQFNNLLFQSYDVWYSMPAQGFSVMAGVGFTF